MKETQVRGCGGWTFYPHGTHKRGTSCDCFEKGWGVRECNRKGPGADLRNVPRNRIWNCHNELLLPD
jgi:hypothetical protein